MPHHCAIALAHDLGHTPFDHAVQDALNACEREHGGFEHNLQSLCKVRGAAADYIAGMTDRYAIREHKRIFAVEEIYG